MRKYTNEGLFNRSVILAVGYCVLQILSNLTVVKTINFAMFYIPFGSILYAISFTWMDVANHFFGVKKIRFLIKLMAVINLFIAIWFRLYILLPTNEWSAESFEANALAFVYGNYLRVTLASIISGYISGNINASVFHYFKFKTTTPIYVWSITSNVLAACMDGVMFYTLAFAFVKSWHNVFLAAISSSLYKGMISLVTIPFLYVLKRNGLLQET